MRTSSRLSGSRRQGRLLLNGGGNDSAEYPAFSRCAVREGSHELCFSSVLWVLFGYLVRASIVVSVWTAARPETKQANRDTFADA